MVELEEVYSWLRKAEALDKKTMLDFGGSQLGYLSAEWVALLQDALVKKDLEALRPVYDHLVHLAQTVYRSPECAEILVECSRGALALGQPEKATAHLKNAVGQYGSHRHQRGVVLWMLGYVYHELLDRKEEGLWAWEQSVETFEHLEANSTLPLNKVLWYREQKEHLRFALECAAIGDCQHAAASPPAAASAPTRLAADSLWLWSVSEAIPAGGFGPTGSDPHPAGEVTVEQVMIDGRPHQVVNLRPGKWVNMRRPGECLTVVRVISDSMNDRGNNPAIDPGDYVLVRVQDSADPNDIVVAHLEDENNGSSTLKLYRPHQNTIGLIPQSKNPAWKPRYFSHSDPRLSIRGVALAVFKPVQP